MFFFQSRDYISLGKIVITILISIMTRLYIYIAYLID